MCCIDMDQLRIFLRLEEEITHFVPQYLLGISRRKNQQAPLPKGSPDSSPWPVERDLLYL